MAELTLSVVLLRGLRAGDPQPARVVRQYRRLCAGSAAGDGVRCRARVRARRSGGGRRHSIAREPIPGVESAAVSSRPPVHGGRGRPLPSTGVRQLAQGPGASRRRHSDQRRLLLRRWAFRSSGGVRSASRTRRIAAGRDRQRNAGAPDLPRRGSDRAPDSPQRARTDDLLRRGRAGRERVARNRRRRRRHPPGQPGRGARGDDLPAVYADRRTRHVPDGAHPDGRRRAACGERATGRAAEEPIRRWTGGRSVRCGR